MTRKTRALGAVAAFALAAGSLVFSVPAAAAAQFGVAPTGPENMTTCVVAKIGITQGIQGAEFAATDTAVNTCFTPPIFGGENLAKMGYPTTGTINNYAELKAVLAGWSLSRDGYPGIGQWVNLSPAMAAGMKAAGINPTAFLQWLAKSLPVGDTWPPFVPKTALSISAVARAMVGESASIIPSSTAAAPVQSTPVQKPVAPVVAPKTVASSTAASSSSTTSGETVASSTKSAAVSSTAAAETPAQVRSAIAAAKPTLVMPPASAKLDGITVPCSVAPSCAPKVAAYRKGVAQESRWRKLANGIWFAFGREIEIAGIAVGAIVLGLGTFAFFRRLAAAKAKERRNAWRHRMLS